MTIDPLRAVAEVAPLSVPAAGAADAAQDLAARDLVARNLAADEAALVIRRVGDALGDLALAVDGLQAGLGPTIAAAAVRDAALLMEAQRLDLVSQSLRGLVDFLAAVGQRRIGQEPLHLDRIAGSLPLKSLADRLAGASPETADDEADWF